MPEIPITKLSDDELALLVAHGALEADRQAAQAEQLRRKAAEAKTPRQQRPFRLVPVDCPPPAPSCDCARLRAENATMRELLTRIYDNAAAHASDDFENLKLRALDYQALEDFLHRDEQHDEPGEGKK